MKTITRFRGLCKETEKNPNQPYSSVLLSALLAILSPSGTTHLGEENRLKRVLTRKLDLITQLDDLESLPLWKSFLREYRFYLESYCNAEIPRRDPALSGRQPGAPGSDGTVAPVTTRCGGAGPFPCRFRLKAIEGPEGLGEDLPGGCLGADLPGVGLGAGFPGFYSDIEKTSPDTGSGLSHSLQASLPKEAILHELL